MNGKGYRRQGKGCMETRKRMLEDPKQEFSKTAKSHAKAKCHFKTAKAALPDREVPLFYC